MYHVYFLRSSINPRETYIGYTELMPEDRLAIHNRRDVPFTSR